MGSTQKNNRMSYYTPTIQTTSQRTKDVFRVNIIIESKSDKMLEHFNKQVLLLLVQYKNQDFKNKLKTTNRE